MINRITLTGLILIAVLFLNTKIIAADKKQGDFPVILNGKTSGIKMDLKIPKTKTAAPELKSGTQTIFSDGFETSFPGSAWTVGRKDATYTDAYWGRTNAGSSSGSYSVFCAAAGSQAVANPATDNYLNNMYAIMYAGPFNISSATAGSLTLKRWIQTEYNYDFITYALSADGTNWVTYSESGDSSGWLAGTIDLSNFQGYSFLGASTLYIAFQFTSDEMTTAGGVFIDEVLLNVDLPGPTPTPTPTPTPAFTPTPSPTPSPSPTPTPPPAYSSQFTVYNDGNATLQVTGITKQNNSAWLTVVPPSGYPVLIAPSQNAVFQVLGSDTGLAQGTYTDRLIVTSNVTGKSPYPNGINITLNKQKLSGQVAAFLIREKATAPAGADANADGKIDVADIVKLIITGR